MSKANIDLTFLLSDARVQGTLTPDTLFRHIVKETGKVDYLAVFILSDIIYWYRPSKDGNKRFWGDCLQKSYDVYAEKFYAPKRTVKASFDLLESLGLIKREFRTVSLKSGQKISNLLFIKLNVLKVNEILFENSDLCFDEDNSSYNKPFNIVMDKKEVLSETDIDASFFDTEKPDTKSCNSLSQNIVIPPTKKCRTNTYTNTITITNNNHSFHSDPKDDGMNESKNHVDVEKQIRDIIRDNIELDSLMIEQKDCADMYKEFYEIMVDLCVHNKKPVRIRGNSYSAESVKERMLMLRREHIESVCENYENHVGTINDYYAHITASLYRSYFEVNNQLRVKLNTFSYGELSDVV